LGKYIFNEIFKEIVDTFYIDCTVLGEQIDRDSSRIRHYKSDGKPGKVVLDKLISSICEIIRSKNDSYMNHLFMEQTNRLIQTKELFSEDFCSKLSDIDNISVYISLLLRKSLEFSASVSGTNTSSSEGPELSLGSHRLITQVDQAHQYFLNNLYPEAIAIYERIIIDSELMELPALKQTVYSELGLIYRNNSYDQYSPELLTKALHYLEIAANLSIESGDLMNYALNNKYLGTIYSYQFNFDDSENNLKKASHHYDLSISAFQKINSSEDISKVLINYGILFQYYATIRNSRNFLKNSISYLKKALEHFDNDSNSYFKALACMSSAASYSLLSEVCNTESNSTHALQMVQQALKIFTIEDYPAQYAQCVFTLGYIHFILASCKETVSNCNKAINYTLHGMGIINNEADFGYLVINHLNLSAIYSLLSHYAEPQENIAKAIDSLEKCHTYYKEQSNTIPNLKSNYNYAEVLIAVGEISKDSALLKEAEDILIKLVDLCETVNFTYFKTMSKYNLAKINYLYYKTKPTAKLLEQAFTYIGQVFDVFTINDYPLNYAQTMLLVAKINYHTKEYDKSKQAYENTLRIISKDKYPEKYATIISEYNELLHMIKAQLLQK